MTGRQCLFVGARVLDPASGLDMIGDLLVADGRVAAIGATAMPRAEPDALIFDAEDHVLAPGLVDLRCHLGDAGDDLEPRFDEIAAAAAAGGVTTVACLADADPAIDGPALVRFLGGRPIEGAKTRLLSLGALTRGRQGLALADLGLMADAGAVGFSDAPRAVASALVMRRALTYAGGMGLLVMAHPTEPALSAGAVATEGEVASRLGLPSVPAAAEAIQVARDLALFELALAQAPARLHIGPLTTAAAIALVRAAKARGLPVTADTSPAYFALNEIAIEAYGTDFKLLPPLRDDDDRRAVVAALADGTLDAIASDHTPHDSGAKQLPFGEAAVGIVGLETLLPIGLEPVHKGELALSRLLALCSTGPARVLGIDAGSIRVGAPADLVLFHPDRAGRVDATKFSSRARASPFHGRPVQGRVVATLLGGRVVFGGPA